MELAETPSAMSEAEAEVYMRRYADVTATYGWNNIAGAQRHWAEKGQKEGRSKAMDPPMTLVTAGCLRDRYLDLAALWKDNNSIRAYYEAKKSESSLKGWRPTGNYDTDLLFLANAHEEW